MEMNQRLFDECVQNYKQERHFEKSKLKTRDDAWNKIEGLAQSNPYFLDLKQKGDISLDLTYNLNHQNPNDMLSPNDDYEDISYEKFETEAKEAKKMIKRDKPLLRRKSELFSPDPQLLTHKSHDPYLVTQSETNNSNIS
ncbi:unnamed protein product [Medioppia subpectinata]|uniref:Uncharacterized protein n=1 Tax=Medioppia subpectinata TaxID=1979941 RepID=A0A7R9QLW0_9ACAR|nr:unnamed protein product [Medioppia subpectinata]CAG2122540.1 unnamed protein product [Medioppia subpectinata]